MILAVIPKIRTPLKYDDSVKSIKYLTPLRAVSEYMLSTALVVFNGYPFPSET